jgi:hypothetical protein
MLENNRKIISNHSGSFWITIPKTWLLSNNLSKGDCLNVVSFQDFLFITKKGDDELKEKIIKLLKKAKLL